MAEERPDRGSDLPQDAEDDPSDGQAPADAHAAADSEDPVRQEPESQTARLLRRASDRSAVRLKPRAQRSAEKEEKGFSAMDHSVKAAAHPAASRSLRDAIRKARLEEAERLDQAADHRDGELARLELLKVELETVFADIPNHDDRFNLALVPSRPARLWIDLFTYVTVDDGTNVYLFVRNSENGRRTLFRSTNVAEMADRITDYVAAQIVHRERMEAALLQPDAGPEAGLADDKPQLNTRMVVMSFIIGLLTGAVGLFAAVWLSAT